MAKIILNITQTTQNQLKTVQTSWFLYGFFSENVNKNVQNDQTVSTITKKLHKIDLNLS